MHFAPNLHPEISHPYLWFQSSLSRKDQRHNCGLCILFGRRDRLSVDVQGRTNRRVSKQLLHHFELSANAPQKSRVRMPESVPPKALLDSKFSGRGPQIFVQNCLPPIRLFSIAMPTRENPVFRLTIRGLFFPLGECFADSGMDWHRLLRRFRFARSHKAVNDGACHVHCFCREIDIAPFQREQFALPDAC